MDFRELDRQVLVASDQMFGAYMKDAAAKGVTLVVNNRPDHEETGQASAAELERAARAEGMDYVHIPVGREFTDDKVAALGEALAGVGEGRALLFCRSGTRSTYLWALARAKEGAVPDALAANAARAGYSLRPLMDWLRKAGDAPG